VVVVAEVEKFSPRELGVVVGNDRVGDAETADDVGEEKTASSEWMLTMGRALIHFENLSTATKR
jgi:hypothetical protein